MKKVLLLGAYGQSNLGDEALLQVFLEKLRHHQVTVLSSSPEKTRATFGVDAISTYGKDNLRKMQALLKSDAVVFGGGSVLKEIPAKYGRRPLSLLLHTLVLVSAAKILGKKVIFSAVGAGPVEGKAAKVLARWCVNLADSTTVRDKASADLLVGIGVRKKIYVVADPAMLLTRVRFEDASRVLPEELKAVGDCPIIGIAPVMAGDNSQDQAELISRLARVCDFFIETTSAKIVLIPFQTEFWPQNDLKTAIQIREASNHKDSILVIRDSRSPSQMLALISRLDFLVGMRLHSLIFASIQRVPFAAVEYEVKVGNLLNEMNLKTVSVSSNGKLPPGVCRALFTLWADREAIVRVIDQAHPMMVERAERNFEILSRALS